MTRRKKSSFKRKITVVGCGKLGLPLVAVLANAGHEVKGFDLSESLISTLSSNEVPWFEESLQQMLRMNCQRIEFTSDPSRAYLDSEYFLIIVPSPSNIEGVFDSMFVESALFAILRERKGDTTTKIKIVIVSTLMPGATDELFKKLHEEFGDQLRNYDIIYSPEFIALGSVIRDMTHPDLVLVGTYNESSAQEYEKLVKSYVKTSPYFAFLSPKEAEIAKIAVNSFVTTKISFANFISELCDASGNASASKVLHSIGTDSRIGRSYLNAGAPFGGPCFPRDNIALSKYSSGVGVEALLATSTHQINQRQIARIAGFIEQRSNLREAVLVGVAYKPGTEVTEESPSLTLASRLQKEWNVLVLDDYMSTCLPNKNLTFTTRASLRNSPQCVILMVPDNKYADIPLILHNQSVIFDLWGNWRQSAENRGLAYFRLGDRNE